ncbi:MAG TPA: PSD1 and planctomycete cytochrome C domain-containing protein [Bryobacteraceae bacterium]|nr:PSD1 and planctomycete cytochrome C domain-containing protein [Bryobacteraceae bacterium]
MKLLLPFALLTPVLLAAEDLPRQAIEILTANCSGCHGEALRMSKLDLRSRESMLAGGERGPALEPGDPAKSRLYRLAARMENPSMPPGKELPDWQLEVLKRWIGTGAPMPAGPPRAQNRDAALTALENRPITEEERRFWSFQPVARRDPPAVKDSAWVRNPVDAFLLAALEAKGLKPSPPSDKRALIRRAYLDVTGLPPDPAEVTAFLADRSPDAFERVVDRLLASPHYGERWARHWLDLVRYADSGGYEYDRDRPQAWRYRDYVVRAFNSDRPYDRFIREQIAGDELEDGGQDALLATGYLRLGPEQNIKTEVTRMDEMDDILATTGGAFLGMTLGCARCHNHKFDPIPQKDYYRMQAVFFSTKARDYPLVSAAEVEKHKAEEKRIEGLTGPLRKELAALERPYRDRILADKKSRLPEYLQTALRTPPEKRTEGQRLNVIQVDKSLKADDEEVKAAMKPGDRARATEIESEIAELQRSRPEPVPAAIGITESSRTPLDSYFLHRGSVDQKGSLMQPGVLSVAAKGEVQFPAPPAGAGTSYRRRGFADWVASPENPLTARVMVNRIWEHHFGEGIVRTPSNFGRTGAAPTHPELLDWLASEFVRRKWSMKAMHRLLLTSSAYRMASDDDPQNARLDPDNRLLWRMPRRRLEGENIRDNVLAVAGTLDRRVGGPGVYPYIDPALWQGSSGRKWPGQADSDPSTWRRSLYVFSKRSIPLPMLEVFDKPDAISSCARRNSSITAPQALILMNNSFMLMQARFFAQRLQREAGAGAGPQIDRAFELTLSRPPSQAEKERAAAFIAGSPEGLVDFCQALLNTNEFVYLP